MSSLNGVCFFFVCVFLEKRKRFHSSEGVTEPEWLGIVPDTLKRAIVPGGQKYSKATGQTFVLANKASFVGCFKTHIQLLASQL